MIVDRKGIFSFLFITFGLTYTIEGLLILSGFRIEVFPSVWGEIIIIALMWVPTLSTIITVKCVTHEEFEVAWFKPGSWNPYLVSALVIPLCFSLIYGLSWLFGLGQPDLTLKTLQELIRASGAPHSAVSLPSSGALGLLVLSLTLTPFVNSFIAFGEECGWRAYLLPKLIPLGKIKAYLFLGIIWGLWHAPLIWIGLNYPDYPVWGTFTFIGVTTTVGIFINELTLYYHSVILASWLHGVFNSQVYGIWRVMFPAVNPVLGGFTGLVGIMVWLALGLTSILVLKSLRNKEVV